MKRYDFLGPGIWFFLGVGICIGASEMSLGSFKNPGPGLFPFILGAILTLLSIILVIQLAFKKKILDSNSGSSGSLVGLSRTILVCLALIAYAVLMEYLGFVISSAVFLGFLLGPIASQKWQVVVAVSVLASLILGFVFKTWLNLPLPAGILGW